MNYIYGRRSKSILETVNVLLAQVFVYALDTGLMDITIIDGRRSRQQQNLYYAQGRSKVQWPNSKHNVRYPHDLSKAIDAAPYVNGKTSSDFRHCIFLAGVIQTVGYDMGVSIRWGGNWDMDGEPVTDQDFQDLWHYELIT